MNRLSFRIMLLLISFPFLNTVKAENVNTPHSEFSPKPLTIEDSTTFILKDKKTSQAYQIFLSVPKEPPPVNGYPILYITDANSIFNTVRETIRSYEKRLDNVQKNHVVLVGIGYPPKQNILKLRTYDLTPPKNTSIPVPYKTGGAEDFYHFIHNDLSPLLDKHLMINHQKQALFGHSFGGLFTLYTLIHHPNAYQTYIAASPSLWLDPNLINGNISQFVTTLRSLKQKPTLFISVGEYEQKFPDYWQTLPQAAKIKQELIKRQQVSHMHTACKTLTAITDLVTTCTDFPNEDHQSVIPVSIGRAIPIMFRSFAQ